MANYPDNLYPDNKYPDAPDDKYPRHAPPRMVQYPLYEDGTQLPQGWLVRYHPAADRWTATYVGMPRVWGSTRAEVEAGVRVQSQSDAPAAPRPAAAAAAAPAQPGLPTRFKLAAMGAGFLAVMVAAAAGWAVASLVEPPEPQTIVQQVTPAECLRALDAGDGLVQAAAGATKALDNLEATTFRQFADQLTTDADTYAAAAAACRAAG